MNHDTRKSRKINMRSEEKNSFCSLLSLGNPLHVLLTYVDSGYFPSASDLTTSKFFLPELAISLGIRNH